MRGERCAVCGERSAVSVSARRLGILAAAAVLAIAPVRVHAQAPRAQASRAQADSGGVQRLAADLAAAVERAVGLHYRRAPVVALRSRDQVRAYLDRKIDQELPPAELAASARAYRAFGLIPDTTDLRKLLLDLYSEQVAGFYDPDSSVLYLVRGADPMMVRMVLSHELVHALQDQYTRLNAILKLRRQNDRQEAGQAMAEGQATVAGLKALFPGADLGSLGGLQRQAREGLRAQQEAMPVFADAPLILREDLLFPYAAGAEFIQDFEQRRRSPDEEPYGARMPISTEQVLHPAKYTAGERPARIRLSAPAGDTLVYDDDFGEFDIGIALQAWGLGEVDALAAAAGWDGDRFELLGSRAGTALVWVTAWDTATDATEFQRALRAGWGRRTGAAEGAYASKGAQRRWRVDRLASGGVPVVRLTDAPAAWAGWRASPGFTVTPPPPPPPR